LVLGYDEGETMIREFRKRPTVVRAVQWTGSNKAEVEELVPDGEFQLFERDARYFNGKRITAKVYDTIHSSWIFVRDEDWIIEGVGGEHYPIDPDVFAATYEAVDNG
jgi:hypothetical protein